MVEVQAHRGFAGQYPENTVAAVRAAVADGADAVEVDVAPSADGDPVVFHDARLDDRDGGRGITDGRGRVWEVTTDDLAGLSVLDTGDGVPTLSETCRAVPPTVTLNVELKHAGPPASGSGSEAWREFVERVAGVLADADCEALFSSFSDGALAAARAVAPDVPRAVLYGGHSRDAVERARRHEAAALHPPVSAVAGTRYFDPETHGDADVVAVAADEGWDVNAWTVRTWHEADRLRAAGVDGLVADYPGLLDGPT
ncbi:MAG: glycerophosphodiester phosphodiesterase [Halobacteriaceae archaeon]